MTTIARGNTAEIYVPLSCSMTFTPGTGGAIRVAFSARSGSAAIAPRFIQSETTIDVSAGSTVFAEAITADATYTDPALTAAQVAALGAVANGGGLRARKVRSQLGAEAFDLMSVSGLPAGNSFSGAGSYASAGVLAVQSTGTVTHNASGWHDGSACMEFTPNTDSSAEFRIYLGGQPNGGLNISDENGLGFEFELPADFDTSKVNFSIHFDFSSDAANLFPTNTQFMRVWVCDQTTATTKEKGGRKYIRNRWDATAATDVACGAWPGLTNVGVGGGAGADRTALCKWIRFRMNKFSGKTLKFKSVRLGGFSTPTIVLGSDAVAPEALVQAFGYLAAKGLQSYSNQYLSQLTDAPSLDRLQRMYATGAEVCGNDTVDRALGSAVTDETEMRSAIETTRAALATYRFTRGARAWVANNNSTSYLMIRELARAGYVMNRNGATDGRYIFPEGGVPDAFRLPAITLDGLNFTEMQPLIDRAIVYGCTLWPYWHGVISSARIDADRTANVTGTATAPIARSGTETPAQYRARALALGTAVGTASVTYFDARLGSAALGVWWEEIKQLFDYLAPKNQDGSCAVVAPEEWAADVGLLAY